MNHSTSNMLLEYRRVVREIHATGVTTDDVFCGDWREGENILMSGQQIALKFELRRLGLRA